MRKVRILAGAEADANEAVAYLDAQREGLGDRFEQDLQDTVNLVRERPLSGKRIREPVRQFPLRAFSYKVIYIYGAHDDEVVVVAVAHHRRHPDYWRSRLQRMR